MPPPPAFTLVGQSWVGCGAAGESPRAHKRVGAASALKLCTDPVPIPEAGGSVGSPCPGQLRQGASSPGAGRIYGTLGSQQSGPDRRNWGSSEGWAVSGRTLPAF